MAYRANVGGIMGSGEYLPSAPQIDVAGTINALSNAFRTTRESAVQRALMVAQAQREQRASQLAEAQAAQNGVLPTSAAHAYVKANNDAYDAANPDPTAYGPASPALASPTQPPPVSSELQGAPAPAPRLRMPGAAASPAPSPAAMPAGSTSTPDGRPMMAAPLTAPIASGGRRRLSMPIDLGNGYSMIPELTPAARQYELLNARMGEMEAIGAGHDQARVAVAAAHDSTSAANTQARVAASVQTHATPSGSAIYAADHRRPPASQDPDVQEGKRASFVLSRIKELTKPTKGLGGLTKPGMSLDDATHQANVEWAAAHGQVPAPRQPVAAGPSNDESGAAAQSEYDTAAQKYQQALHLGIDPALARDAYNTDVMAIAKKHGHR